MSLDKIKQLTLSSQSRRRCPQLRLIRRRAGVVAGTHVGRAQGWAAT